jgi:hypothetical protein
MGQTSPIIVLEQVYLSKGKRLLAYAVLSMYLCITCPTESTYFTVDHTSPDVKMFTTFSATF